MLPFGIAAREQQGGQELQGDEEQANTEFRDRVRRAQVVRLGLILCLLLALFDSTPSPRELNEQAQDSKPSPYKERLNALINDEKRSLHISETFPRNVTGLYRGSWARFSSHDNGTGNAASAKASPVSIGIALSTLSGSGVSPTSGKILMQLKSVAIENVAEMSFVYGVIRLSGAGVRGADLLYPTQGVFLPSTGQLTMITSPYSTQKLYVQVPAVDAPLSFVIGQNSSSSLQSRGPSRVRGRRLEILQTEEAEVGNLDGGVWGQVEQFVLNQQSMLQARILSEDGLLLALPPLEHANLPKEEQGRRRLSDDGGGFYSTKLPYGMRLVLADAVSIGKLRKNSTSMLTECVSEGLLPATFKNLQFGVLRGVSQGGCQMAVSFAAAALVINQNDKDIPLLPGISPASPKLTPTVGSGESFSSNLNGAVEAQPCGVSNSGFNISAQSYHLQVNVVEHKVRSFDTF